MSVLVTGANGFVGSQVVRLLANVRQHVYALCRPGCKIDRIRDVEGLVDLVEGDLLDDTTRRRLAELRPGLCIHSAWYLVPGNYLNDLQNVAMLQASVDLALRLADAGCNRFLGVGTCFEYGNQSVPLSEDMSLRPASLYAACKAALAETLSGLASATKMSTAWVRLFYLYGPGEALPRLVPSVVNALLRGDVARVSAGEQMRDFLHVEDAAKGILAVANSDLTGAVNVASGCPITIRMLVSSIAARLNGMNRVDFGAVPYGPTESMFTVAKIDRAKSIGWLPAIELNQGLEQTIGWWAERLELARGIEV